MQAVTNACMWLGVDLLDDLAWCRSVSSFVTSCTPYVVVRILSDGSFPRLRLVLECHVLIYMNVEISFLNSCHIFTQFTLLLKLTHILTLIKELAHCICVVIIPLVNLELDKLLNRQKLTLFW